MMLWYKGWRETRTRFLISSLVLTVFCLVIVLLQQRIRSHGPVLPGFSAVTYSQHIYQFIYSGMAKAIFIWILFFLGLGGLRREHAHGTAGFTLALPVSRVRLVVVRMTLGLLQVSALALLPALLIPTTSLLVHQSYPLAESLHFSVLWICCGAVLYSMTFLFSVVFGGEYTALVVSFVVFFLQDLILSQEPFKQYRLKLLYIMSDFGTMHWDAQHILLSSEPLPWVRLALFSLVAFSMLAISVGVARRQDL